MPPEALRGGSLRSGGPGCLAGAGCGWPLGRRSPGRALGLQASPGLCMARGGMLFQESAGRGDLTTRRAEILLRGPLGQRTAGDFHTTATYRSQEGQMPNRCPERALPKTPACLPTCLVEPGSRLLGAWTGSTSPGPTKARGGWTLSPRCWLVSSPPHLPPPSLLTPTSNP